MPMPPYPVLCVTPRCGAPAAYKIAARWSDGVTAELKTYSLCCRACLADQYHSALERCDRCRRTPGETIEKPAIFEFAPERSDRDLRRLSDLEESL